jgi:hypothetical protein
LLNYFFVDYFNTYVQYLFNNIFLYVSICLFFSDDKEFEAPGPAAGPDSDSEGKFYNYLNFVILFY